MEMRLRHETIKREETVSCSVIYSGFLNCLAYDMYSSYNKKPSPTTFEKFVLVPDGFRCFACNVVHGYPSHQLTETECETFINLLERCPCYCTHIELPRHWLVGCNDYLDVYFKELDRKFNSLEELMIKNQELQENSWKLVWENKTIKESFSIGPIVKKLLKMPEGVLDDCKIWFHELLNFFYRNKLGFIKGKYLVVSTELLFRFCEGEIDLFLNYLSQAYSLVQSQYCSISKMAIEAGFWQVCPELFGFFWKNIDFKINFPFLKKFMKDKTIFIKNFSLSMGPHYLIGGGYFSYIYNTKQDLVVWYLPNFWAEDYFGFDYDERTFFGNSTHFWFGNKESQFGCYYNGVVTEEVCDCNMLQFLDEQYRFLLQWTNSGNL